MEKRQPAVPASTLAVANDAVAGSAAMEPASIPCGNATATTAATLPACPSPSPSDFLGIPTEMHDNLLSFLLDGDSTSPLPKNGDQASAGGLAPGFENWEALDYDDMDGDNLSALSGETKGHEAEDGRPAASAGSVATTEGHGLTSNLAEISASAGTATPAGEAAS